MHNYYKVSADLKWTDVALTGEKHLLFDNHEILIGARIAPLVTCVIIRHLMQLFKWTERALYIFLVFEILSDKTFH